MAESPGGLVFSSAVAEALDYAHQRGLLHRGVKPANILLTTPDSGARRILLADFGIARHLDDISGLTATNVTVADNGNSPVAAMRYADATFARTNVTLLNGTNTFTACQIGSDTYAGPVPD